MSIKSILENADKVNVAKGLSKEKLQEIADWVCEGHDSDKSTMKDWEKLIDEGLKVAKPELIGADYPWDGASNYKSPLIGEAVRNFGDRATSEILRPKDLAAGVVCGEKTPEKEALLKRRTTHLNYQLNYEIKGWRTQQERGFYGLAAQGAKIKKSFFDSTTGTNNSEWIGYPNFSLNNECDDFAELDRFTHVRKFTENDIFTKKNSGEWIVDEFEVDDEKECYYTFLECYGLYDIDDDGYAEPYIITVHQASNTVVRIAPNYQKSGVYVYVDGKTKKAEDVKSELSEEYQQNELMTDAEKEEFSSKELSKLYRKAKLVRIERDEMLTLYNFTIPIDGTLLGMGFLHLMSSSVKGINKASNSLFNAGDLANLQGGFLSKEHRSPRSGKISTSPGKWNQTNITARDLASSFFPFQNKEPSPSFMQMNELLKAEVESLGTKTNISDALSPNVPAVSVLGMLQEGIIPTTALIARIVNAMTNEFKVLSKLNAIYTDPMDYARIVGDPNADYEADYQSYDIDIKPTANAQMSSQYQRLQIAQVKMEYLPQVLQVGGNGAHIVKGFYAAVDSSDVDMIFPPDGQMSDQDRAMNEQMMAMQKAQMELQQEQQRIANEQLSIMQQSQDLKDKEVNAKIDKENTEQMRKNEETMANIKKIQADIIKTLEEAESESLKNKIDIYNKEFDNTMRILEHDQRARQSSRPVQS